MRKLFLTFKNSFPCSHVCPHTAVHLREEPAPVSSPPDALEEELPALENSALIPPWAFRAEAEETQLRQQTEARERGLLAASPRPEAWRYPRGQAGRSLSPG